MSIKHARFLLMKLAFVMLLTMALGVKAHAAIGNVIAELNEQNKIDYCLNCMSSDDLEVVRNVLAAAREFESNSYKATIYEAYVGRPDGDIETVIAVLAEVRELESDYDKATIYEAYVGNPNADLETVNAVLAAAREFESNSYKVWVYKAYLQRDDVDLDIVDEIFEAVKELGESAQFKIFEACLMLEDIDLDIIDNILKAAQLFEEGSKSQLYALYIKRDDADKAQVLKLVLELLVDSKGVSPDHYGVFKSYLTGPYADDRDIAEILEKVTYFRKHSFGYFALAYLVAKHDYDNNYGDFSTNSLYEQIPEQTSLLFKDPVQAAALQVAIRRISLKWSRDAASAQNILEHKKSDRSAKRA